MLIGVYHSTHPLQLLPAARIEALTAEASRQQVELVLFGDDGIDLQSNEVRGHVYENGAWTEKSLPLPTVVMNEWAKPPRERTPKEQRLNRRATFTTFCLPGKYKVMEYMLESDSLCDLILPTVLCLRETDVLQAASLYGNVLLKPDEGRQGEGIAVVEKTGDGFLWRSGTDSEPMTERDLIAAVRLLTAGRGYLIQPYVQCLTAEGEPFDFRAHVQRNGQGEWTVTRIYPRCGLKGAVASNLSQGGEPAELTAFLRTRFPDRYEELGRRLRTLGLEIAEHLDGFFDFQLDELGIDLAIGGQEKFWFYEANTSPQTRYHEEERAVNAIAYAKYLATRSGQLHEVPSHRHRRPLIGMLTDGEFDPVYAEACAAIALLHEADFCYFYPDDVFFGEKRLIGHAFERGGWQKRSFEYPDVLLDRLKHRGLAVHSRLYAELSAIPTTHELRVGSMSKSRVYRVLEEGPAEVGAGVIPYMPIEDAGRAKPFVDRWGHVVIKPDVGSHGQQIVIVRKRENDYELFDQDFYHYLPEAEFAQFLRMIADQGYVAQPFIDSSTKEGFPFHLRVHLMKRSEAEWEVVFVQPYLALSSHRKVTNHEQTLRIVSKWEWFLGSEFTEELGGETDIRLRKLAMSAARHLQATIGTRFHELALDVGIDPQRRFWIFEANFNRIGNSFHPFEAARYAIPYVLSCMNEKAAGT